MSELPADAKEGASVPQAPAGITVTPSALNRVKLELAVVLVIAVTLYALVEVLLSTGWIQVLILAGYGGAAGMWLALRTWRVVAETAPDSDP